MRLIYIVGASHSGSTLLDMMLNAHPEIISVGEVFKLNRIKRSRSGKPKVTRCSCGALGLVQCEFWSRVNERTMRIHGKSFVDLNLNEYRQYDKAANANSILFQGISEVSGKDFVVDSSKMPRRLNHLMQLNDLNVYPIYLIRNPRGQIASVFARNGLLKSILHHELVYAQTRWMLKSARHTIVRYEDLVTEPERTLDHILEPLGLRFHPRQLHWAEQAKHSFAGNHVRMQTKSELVLDEKWKHALTARQLRLIDIGTLFSRNSMRKIGVELHGR